MRALNKFTVFKLIFILTLYANAGTKKIKILSGIQLMDVEIRDNLGNTSILSTKKFSWTKNIPNADGSYRYEEWYTLKYKMDKSVKWIDISYGEFQKRFKITKKTKVIYLFKDMVKKGRWVPYVDYYGKTGKKKVPYGESFKSDGFSRKLTKTESTVTSKPAGNTNNSKSSSKYTRVFTNDGKSVNLLNANLIFLVGLEDKKRVLTKIKVNTGSSIYEVNLNNIKSIQNIRSEKNFNYDIKSAKVNLKNGRSVNGSFNLNLIEGVNEKNGLQTSISITEITEIYFPAN